MKKYIITNYYYFYILIKSYSRINTIKSLSHYNFELNTMNSMRHEFNYLQIILQGFFIYRNINLTTIINIKAKYKFLLLMFEITNIY